MERSFIWVIIGIIFIAFAFPTLWYNEKRSAQFESLIASGEEEVQTVTCKEADTKNHNSLVHVNGGKLFAAKPVEDPDFNVSFEKGCILLKSTIEIYQWQEQEEKAKPQREERGHNQRGHGDAQPTFTYTKGWSCFYNDGRNFHDKSHKNSKPAEIHPDPIGSMMHSEVCSRVEFGNGFLLPKGLVEGAAESKAWTAQQDVTLKKSGKKLKKSGKQYCSGDPNKPEIGDIRVQFEMAPDGGTASVLALQVEAEHVKGQVKDGRATFVPYRNIRRAWCSFNENADKMKEDRAAEGRKDLVAAAEKDLSKMSFSCATLCCCACTIVEMVMSAVLHPELFEVTPGKVDSQEMFDAPKIKNGKMTWIFRLVGWALMFFGLGFLFGPLTTLISVIPFLGPLLAGLGSVIVWVFSFLVTLVISFVIIGLAYSVYNPKITLICFAIIGGIVALIMGISSATAPTPAVMNSTNITNITTSTSF